MTFFESIRIDVTLENLVCNCHKSLLGAYYGQYNAYHRLGFVTEATCC